MDDAERRRGVEHILSSVRTPADLSPDVINRLKETNAGRIAIDNFHLEPAEFASWYLSRSYTGVEYDPESKRIIVKAIDSAVHDAIFSALEEWLERVAADLRGSNYPYFAVAKRSHGICTLQGPYEKWVKEPDLAIIAPGRPFPSVVVEIGVTEETQELVEILKKWFEGSNGQTKVIIVQVNERPPVTDFLQRDGPVDRETRALYDDNLKRLATRFGARRLGEVQLLRWKSIGMRLVGTLRADINIMSPTGHQSFSLGTFALDCPLLPRPVVVGFPISKLDLLSGEYPKEYFYSLDTVRQLWRQFSQERNKLVQTGGVFYLPLANIRQRIHQAMVAYEVQRATYKAKVKMREWGLDVQE